MEVVKIVDIRNTSLKMEDTQKVNNALRKKVFDVRGKEVGRISSVHIDPDKLTVEGISVSKGPFRENVYIGKEYIRSLTKEGAVLSQIPLSEYIGMKVLDSHGRHIGKVKGVNRARKTNSPYSIKVSRKGKKSDLVVTENIIGKVGEKIILKEKIDA